MKYLLFSLLLTSVAHSRPLRIAVIDTGINIKYVKQANLCKSGHKSFAESKDIYDTHGHGTNIAGLIKYGSGNAKYCLIIIRYFSKNTKDLQDSFTRSLEHAFSLKPDMINISGGGVIPDYRERVIIKKLLDSGVTINAAAGNEKSNLDDKCNYFPACYDDRINVIGAKNVPQSNYGRIIDFKLNGKNRSAFGISLSGTSQSTAVFTGLMIRLLDR